MKRVVTSTGIVIGGAYKPPSTYKEAEHHARVRRLGAVVMRASSLSAMNLRASGLCISANPRRRPAPAELRLVDLVAVAGIVLALVAGIVIL